jgi:hypothetical protein
MRHSTATPNKVHISFSATASPEKVGFLLGIVVPGG